MLNLANEIYENIHNPEKIYEIFTNNDITNVFFTCKDSKGKFCCNVERYFNWGYNGKMEYFFVSFRDMYYENAWLIDPKEVVGIIEFVIWSKGKGRLFRFVNGKLKDVTETY